MNFLDTTIGVVGLGLIGGSVARAVKKYTSNTVYGLDTADITNKARENGIIDACLTSENAKNCKLIFVALYPKATVDYINENSKFFANDTIVIDLCGIKRFVIENIENKDLKFIGGHPMAGKEVSGFNNSSEDLFLNASMILTESKFLTDELFKNLKELFNTIGFTNVVVCSAEKHDRVIAYTSELAHILSNAYVKSPTSSDFKGFSAGSFKDLTRVAKVNGEMWAEIFMENKDYIEVELKTLIQNLQNVLDALEGNDKQKLFELLQEGTEIKERIEKEWFKQLVFYIFTKCRKKKERIEKE